MFNPSTIRATFKEAEPSTLTPHGFSHFERYEREMQSVDVDENDKIAFDWTFDTAKNFNEQDAKAVFTGNKGSTKEIITLALVPSTAASQTSHLLLQSREKRKTLIQEHCMQTLVHTTKTFGKEYLGLTLY